MWFNNALIYQTNLSDFATLEDNLQQDILKPCPPHARFIYGWSPVFAESLVHTVAGSVLICLGKEERILPSAVIQKMLAEKIQKLEAEQGFSVKRAEKAQMAEDLEFDLLPKSFCIQKRLYAMFDTTNQQLIINTASSTQAGQLLALLRKSVPGLTIEPLRLQDNLAKQFSHWVQEPQKLPADFQLASDCLLYDQDNEKKRVHCKEYELPAEEITNFITQGMALAELSLIWQERIQFTLSQDFVLKKIKCLDYLITQWEEIKKLDELAAQQDASLSLVSGELRQLSQALMSI